MVKRLESLSFVGLCAERIQTIKRSICDDQLYSNKSYETFTIRTYEYRGEAEIYSKTCKYEWFTCKCETLGVVCRVADAVCEPSRISIWY